MSAPCQEPHDASVVHEHERDRAIGCALVVSSFCRFRARCSCGWSSDSYANVGDADRALRVHLRRVDRDIRVLDYPANGRSQRSAPRRARLRG